MRRNNEKGNGVIKTENELSRMMMADQNYKEWSEWWGMIRIMKNEMK